MVSRTQKLMQHLPEKEREELEEIIQKTTSNNLAGLDVIKLQGKTKTYRVRKGRIRIIFVELDGCNRIIAVKRRNDHTY